MSGPFDAARLPGALFPPQTGQAVPATDLLPRVVTGDIELEGYRPLPLNLEWRLSALHWKHGGVAPFVTNDVPYLVNNNGVASADAAAVLFANCLDADRSDAVRVLEVGAGSALFARDLLDAFRALCVQHDRDFYDRLLLTVTDGSPRSVARWAELGLFAGHESHVHTAVWDADSTDSIAAAPLRAVFANYVLDSLPASVLRWNGSRWLHLCARAVLRRGTTLPPALAECSPAWLRHAAATQPEALLPLLPLLESDLAFLPIDDEGAPDVARHAPPAGNTGAVVTVNYPDGALRCLDTIVAALAPDGFALIRDYTSGEATPRYVGAQRFGDVTALPLDFSILERHLRTRGIDMVDPGGHAPTLTRLLARLPIATTRQMFRDRFSTTAHAPEAWTLRALARQRADHGLHQEALDLYRQALAVHPDDWQLLADAARFTGVTLGDPASALDLACRAVQRNPWYSPFLWNVLGQCLTQLGRHDEAHDCHLEAARISPGDPETHIHLAASWLTRGDTPRSLEAVARGLAADINAMHRQSLLAVQQAAIDRIAGAGTERREVALRRQARASIVSERLDAVTMPPASGVTAPRPLPHGNAGSDALPATNARTAPDPRRDRHNSGGD